MSAQSHYDLVIENPGLSGFFIVSAQSARGKRWLARNVQDAKHGTAYSDDRKCAWNIYRGAIADGLKVDASNREG
ncbi:MAG TPA: hypothetical protein VEL77_15000 [Rugosimonospora sp.]|nr:hypothetical protein [Rugosimonospora sp.]